MKIKIGQFNEYFGLGTEWIERMSTFTFRQRELWRNCTCKKQNFQTSIKLHLIQKLTGAGSFYKRVSLPTTVQEAFSAEEAGALSGWPNSSPVLVSGAFALRIYKPAGEVLVNRSAPSNGIQRFSSSADQNLKLSLSFS